MNVISNSLNVILASAELHSKTTMHVIKQKTSNSVASNNCEQADVNHLSLFQ